MTYAVKADMQAEFGDAELAQLTDRVNGTVTDDTVLTPALQRADDEINSYVAQRYNLPFAVVPARLKSLAMDITRYYLFDSRAPQIVQNRYNQAIAWLKLVANGQATLGVDTANAQVPSAPGQTISVQASDQVFDDDLLALT